MTRRNENRPLIRHPSPLEIDLMGRLADDLAAGGVETFLNHEAEWLQTPLCSFMQGNIPEPEQPSIDTVAVYSRWNNKAAPSTAKPRSVAELDAAAIYAKWNGSAPNRAAA